MNISLSEIVLFILLTSLLLIALLSFLSRINRKRERKQARELVIHCRLCGHVYISEHDGSLSYCEICDAANLSRRNGKLG